MWIIGTQNKTACGAMLMVPIIIQHTSIANARAIYHHLVEEQRRKK